MISLFDENGIVKTGKSFDSAMNQSRYPIVHARAIVNAMKEDPAAYSTFKSDDSLLAWSMTILYNSYKICPDSFVPHLAPDEEWNWNDTWNQYMPRQ